MNVERAPSRSFPTPGSSLSGEPQAPEGRNSAVALGLILAVVACTPGGTSKRRDGSLGASLYLRDCSSCHGLDGKGRAGAFPPLAGHAAALAAAPGGRAYLVRVPLGGVAGVIDVEGNRYDGVMSSFAFRSDAELAAILDHVLTAWGNDSLLPLLHRPILEGEVAAARREDLGGTQVRALRPRVILCAPADQP